MIEPSGDHAGPLSYPEVSCVGDPPDVPTIQIAESLGGAPARGFDMNAICEPSGDQVGLMSFSPVVTWKKLVANEGLATILMNAASAIAGIVAWFILRPPAPV